MILLQLTIKKCHVILYYSIWNSTMVNGSHYTRLIKFERDLGNNLMSKSGKVFLSHYDVWQKEIVRLAKRSDKIDLSQKEIDKGIVLANRPIFVCGTSRSGTTLFRDIFDGHRNICVLPGEGRLLTNLASRLVKIPSNERSLFFVDIWLRNILTPCVKDPFSVLGRTQMEYSPYIELVRYFLAWWEITQTKLPANKLQPLIAWMLAIASLIHKGFIPPQYQYWMDKTTMNELYLKEIYGDFPQAKFLMMVRNPENVYYSRKERDVRNFGTFTGKWGAFSEIRRSHAIISKLLAEKSDYPVKIIKYEEFVADRAKYLEDICTYLKIDFDDTLNHQTVLGQQAFSNTSFPDEKQLTTVSLNEKKTISALMYKQGHALDYQLISMPFFEKTFFRVKFHFDFFVIRVLRRLKRIFK